MKVRIVGGTAIACLCVLGAAGEARAAAGNPSASCLETMPADGRLPAGTAVKNAFKGVTLTFAANGGEFQKAQEKAFTKPFAECTGAVVRQDATDITKLRAMQQAGNVQWDVVYAGGGPVGQACGTIGMNIPADKVDIGATRRGLLTPCQLGIDIEPTLLVYNTDSIKDTAPKSFDDFFDVKKYPGNRLIWGIPAYPDTGLWASIAASLGWREDSGKPFPYDEVIGKLASIKDHLVYYQTGAEQVQKLEQGDFAFAEVWAARAYTAARNGAPIAPIWDHFSYSDADFFVPVGTKHPDAAFALMNYMLGAEQQNRVAEEQIYGPTNKKGAPHYTPEMKVWFPSEADLAKAPPTSTAFWFRADVTDRQLADRRKFFLGD